MITLDQHPSGRHFLQIPGPSPVPDRILRAISLPTIDHRGPEFGALGRKVVAGMQQIFQTKHPVAIYPASGTGAWEAALANTMSPGDAVLMVETGHFATLWQKMAVRLGLESEFLALPGIDPATGLPNAWRHGVPAALVEERLRKDSAHRIQAVCVVHNETSTGVTSDIAAVRRAIEAVDRVVTEALAGSLKAWGPSAKQAAQVQAMRRPQPLGCTRVQAVLVNRWPAVG
jgi:alanine-glyoxylate transaminase/serine-glyoxylate transaminase/serine-pyruvate transaminase